MEESVFQRMSGHDATHWWFVARRRILRDGIAALGLPPDAQVLESGSGRRASFVMTVPAFGWLWSAHDERHLLRHLSLRVGAPIACIARRG